MQKPKSPCPPNCERRTGTCHGDCPEYVAYEICNSVWRDLLLKEKVRENDLFATSRHNSKKKRRKPYAPSKGAQ